MVNGRSADIFNILCNWTRSRFWVQTQCGYRTGLYHVYCQIATRREGLDIQSPFAGSSICRLLCLQAQGYHYRDLCLPRLQLCLHVQRCGPRLTMY